MKFKIRLDYDQDAENPCEWDSFKVHSFNNGHTNFIRPEKIGIYSGPNGEPMFSSKNEHGKPNEYKKLFERNLLFILSCYQHGNILWSLKGDGPQCQFDTARIAGVIILDENEWKGKRRNKKEEAIRSFLKTYTNWCNGEVYSYTIENEDGEEVDSCCGFYSADDLFKAIFSDINFKNIFGDDSTFEFDGNCAWLAKYHSHNIRTS